MVVDVFPVQLEKVSPQELGILWNDGHRSHYGVRNLRLNCRCAHCVDEWTGESRLDPKTVPSEIKPQKIDTVGRYALNFIWSDGHDTGFYTFGFLRSLCECSQCQAN